MCNAARARRYYRENLEKQRAAVKLQKKKTVIEHRRLLGEYLKAHPCVDCGEGDLVVLEFDHVRGEKKAAVTRLVAGGYSWGTISAEIGKCEVRCRNCHARRTSRCVGSWRLGR